MTTESSLYNGNTYSKFLDQFKKCVPTNKCQHRARVSSMDTYFAVLPTDVLQLLSSSVTIVGGQESVRPPSRFLRLPHPRTGLPSLFLPTDLPPDADKAGSKMGILEVQAVSPPEERSWMLEDAFIANGNLLIMTPLDPTFLLLSLMQVPESTNGSLETQFRTSDDIFESIALKFDGAEASVKPLRGDLIRFGALECTQKALINLCEIRELPANIVVYKYSSTKAISYLRAKITRLVASSAFDNSRTVIRRLAKDGLMDDEQEDLLELGRQHACCELVAQYLSADIQTALMNSYDFISLRRHLELKKRDTISDTTPSSSKAMKKPPGMKEPPTLNKKRKAGKQSHGVESLKKVNTSGMAKMSSFFNKKS